MKHTAGRDLTAELGRAPHDASLLGRAQQAGTFAPTRRQRKTTVQKAFYVIAYVNLGLVFVVLFLLAYWRWGV